MERKQSILVVEDHDDLRELFSLVLAIHGFDVRAARSGFEALRMLDWATPDLVVLDLMLPGIDGLALQQELAANACTRQVPVVVVTASSDDLSYLDVACVLRKPVTPDELVATVRRCLAAGAPDTG